MKFNNMSFQGFINKETSVTLKVSEQYGGERVELKIDTSKQYGYPSMTVEEFRSFVAEASAFVDANCKAGREAKTVTPETYTVD